VDAFSRFLVKRTNENKPFLAQVSFHNCHIPFIGTDAAKEACATGETCRAPSPDDPPYTDKELDYYACLTELDNAVGLVLEALETHGYYDNTMVWFTSDNGPEMNCKPFGICQNADTHPHRPVEGPGSAGVFRGRKRDIYEGGHRVPGIVSFPAIMVNDDNVDDDKKKEGDGTYSWETVVTMDFLPTVMDILGVDRPLEQQSWPLDGRSILPLIRNPSTFRWETHTPEGAREIGIGYYDANTTLVNGWGYRYGRWKYVEGSTSCKDDACRKAQLYDLETDLGERHDVSAEHPDILATLQTKFWVWHDSVMKSRRDESRCEKVRDLQLPSSFMKQQQQQNAEAQ
jgi:arylsulfatase A-like enzyme